MDTPHIRVLEIYQDKNGREPFTQWLESIKDRKTRNRIVSRLDRLEVGHFGESKSVGDGVFELRFHFGSGYRIYFGEVDNTIVLLLCGGDNVSLAN